LKEVYVAGTSVSDVGVHWLLTLPDLQVLYLRGCKHVIDKSADEMGMSQTLTRVSISESGISKGAALQLEKSSQKIELED
jgi:hypothetical protein